MEFYPKAPEKLEYNKMQHKFWASTYNVNNEFEQKICDNGYMVGFKTLICSFRHWEIYGILCPHSIFTIYYRKENHEQYGTCLGTTRLKWQWQIMHIGITWRHLMVKSCNGKHRTRNFCRHKRMPGKPKKQNVKELHKARRNNTTDISWRVRQMKCLKCGESRHNKETCRGPPNVSDYVLYIIVYYVIKSLVPNVL